MSPTNLTLLALGLGTYLLKAAGPLVLGGRRLPPALERLADLAPAGLLAALVTVSTFAEGTRWALDARAAGLVAAAVALRLRSGFVVVVIVAAAATALARALAG